MMTEETAIASARTQYRAAFKSMACGGTWHLFATHSGVTLDLEGAHMVVLVPNVQGMAEQTMVNALSDALRRGHPHVWTQAK